MNLTEDQIKNIAKKYTEEKLPYGIPWPPQPERADRIESIWRLMAKFDHDRKLTLTQKRELIDEGWRLFPYFSDLLQGLTEVYIELGENGNTSSYTEALHCGLLLLGLWDMNYRSWEHDFNKLFSIVARSDPSFYSDLLSYLQ